MKIIRKTLLIAGITSIMLYTTAFATEIETIASDQNINEAAVLGTVQTVAEVNTQTQVVEEKTVKTGIVTVDILNIRSGRSTDTEIVGKLSLGETVELLSENEGWHEINFDSKTAYIFGEYIRLIDNTLIQTQNAGSSIVEYAKTLIGTPYAYGGNTPSGFDCSGFVQYVMANFGVVLPRSSTEQYSIGVRVDKSALLPGDLVYFKYSASSYRLSHVGIYVGDGNFIHSPVPGQSVKISSLSSGYFSYYYYGATRVIN